MKIIKPNILVDFDHTLCDATRRDHMLGPGVSWDEYHTDSVNDLPCTDVIELLHGMKVTGFTIIGITARPGKFRKLTMDYSVLHGIPIDELLMRSDEDYRPSPQMKIALAEERFGKEKVAENVLFILEDRDDVAAAFKAIGVTVLQVHSRNYYTTGG